MTTPTLGDRLRTLREQRSLTQMEVAVAVGLARSTLTAIEGNHDLPGRETLVALAEYYDVSLNWLATGSGQQIALKGIMAQTEEEALLLSAWRKLPKEEGRPLLQMMINRTETKT